VGDYVHAGYRLSGDTQRKTAGKVMINHQSIGYGKFL